MNNLKKVLIIISSLFCVLLHSQNFKGSNLVVDEIIAIVGKEAVLLSDLKTQHNEYTSSNIEISECEVLDDILFRKLLVTQAEIDSIEVDDSMVEMELENRLRYYIIQFGSQEKFEEFYGKKLTEIKDEFRQPIKEQMLVEQVKQKITMNTIVTPKEVDSYFNAIPIDQIPEIPMEYEYNQIIKTPEISAKEMESAYNKISDIRKRALDGESFGALAVLYSEDKGSASRSGSIGTVGRGQTFPEFEAAAFSLKEGEISEVVKTEAGYHIIKLNKRKGDYIECQHILITPKPLEADVVETSNFLDSLAKAINNREITFEEAAKKYSDDDTKINGGVVVNPYSGGTWFDASLVGQFGQEYSECFFVLSSMEIGEISKPVVITGSNGADTYRILFLKSRTEPHKANLKDDYNKIMLMAEQEKKEAVLADWVAKKVKKTYVYLKDEYLDCSLMQKWINN